MTSNYKDKGMCDGDDPRRTISQISTDEKINPRETQEADIKSLLITAQQTAIDDIHNPSHYTHSTTEQNSTTEQIIIPSNLSGAEFDEYMNKIAQYASEKHETINDVLEKFEKTTKIKTRIYNLPENAFKNKESFFEGLFSQRELKKDGYLFLGTLNNNLDSGQRYNSLEQMVSFYQDRLSQHSRINDIKLYMHYTAEMMEKISEIDKKDLTEIQSKIYATSALAELTGSWGVMVKFVDERPSKI